MKTTTERTIEALKELIVINNDRHEGYKTAADEAKDSDLKALFNKFSTQSRTFADELIGLLPDKSDAPPHDKTKASGKLYRVWMDIKNAIAGNNRKAILSSCEYGEDVAKKTYEDVLNKSEDITTDVLDIIRRQKSEILQGHDEVKSLRDRES
ncbi:MAG TPA: PA2169 family four-helix-bundle protein [Bacteroidia bacterium]|nr:PA2169 family four-helix-bundle protein [Bacteroidia bacterium]